MLSTVLQELFFDKVDEVLRLLRKHNLETIFEDSTRSVDEMITAGEINRVKLTATAAKVLFGVNSEVKKITDVTEKLYVEMTSRDIGVHLFDKLIDSSDNPYETLQSIKAGLISSCEIGGFNAEALLNLLQFAAKERRYSLPAKPFKNYHYDWNGYDHDLDDLARNLKADGCIQHVKDFKRMFTAHPHSLKVSVDPKHLGLLMTLIKQLKTRKLVTPRGCKGHFKPLEVFCVDLEGKILFKRKPGVFQYLLDKKAQESVRLQEKVNQWISGYKVRSDLQVILTKVTKSGATS